MGPAVRLAAEGDAEAITDIYTPIVERTHISFETTPPSVEEMARRVRATVEQLPWLVCESDGRVVGYAYASTHNDRPAYRWGADVSAYVDERWRRRSVARGLYESLVALLRLQGLYTAYAVIALPNQPSVSFHEALGFERIGVYRRAGFKNGEWHDVGHWERSLQPHETPPAPPKPLEELRNADGYRDALEAGESAIGR